jgi:C4-dicarboxylate transporter DctM subunit
MRAQAARRNPAGPACRPPAAACLGVAIGRLSPAQVSRAVWPQIVAVLVVLFLTTYIPELALILPPRGR